MSLQPLRRVGTEAVIFFSDIFVPVAGLGIEVDFRPGPVVAEPIRSLAQVERLRAGDPRESVPFVFEILRRLRRELAAERVPLIGFAGAPFTLAAYLVEGRGSKEFSAIKRMMLRAPEVLRALQARLTTLVVDYLSAQIEAGAQVVQLFDTWAGLLGPDDYAEWVLPVHREIAAKLDRARAPAHPLREGRRACARPHAGFRRRRDLARLAGRPGGGGPAGRAGARACRGTSIRPVLFAPPETIAARVRAIAAAAAPARGLVLNLGHGCLPDTPVEGARAFTDAARALASPPA